MPKIALAQGLRASRGPVLAMPGCIRPCGPISLQRKGPAIRAFPSCGATPRGEQAVYCLMEFQVRVVPESMERLADVIVLPSAESVMVLVSHGLPFMK